MIEKNKTIYIIGAGAVGKALAVFLKGKGQNVIIIRGSIDNNSSYTEKIKVQFNDKEEFEAEIEISSLSRFTALNGIVVLTNKSYGNEQLAGKLSPKIGSSPVVILQNGLDIEKPFIHNNFPGIYRCVLFTSSQIINTNTVKFKPVSISLIGVIAGDSTDLEKIVAQLDNPYLQFRVEENIQPVIWTKAIVNSVFNSICPLLETSNGIFHRNTKARDIAKRVISECVAVAASQGILLNPDNVLDTLLLISRNSADQLISTYQDIQNKRKTEIETFNSAIVNIADRSIRGGLVSETRILGELVQIKSEISMLS